MKRINKKVTVLMLFLLISPLTFSYSSADTHRASQSPLRIPPELFADIDGEINENEPNTRIIRIAQYPLASNSDQLLGIVFNYTWATHDTVYKFTRRTLTLEEVMGGGNRPLNIENYDLLVVGANYMSYLKDSFKPELQENIKDFLSQGGGYLASCAGVTLASQGYENPKNLYERRTNKGVLKIADVYLNHDFNGEIQYCMRANGLPPIDLKVERDNENPIFTPYTNSTLNLTYGGGPGMYKENLTDPKLGEITPLLTYNEELMVTKTIHFYKKRIIGWKEGNPIETDLLGQYCGVATTYNSSGRLVLFASHAEIPLVVNGTIDEFIGKRPKFSSLGILPRPVYSWVGTPVNMSYNWWIHRRAAAWIAGVPDEDLPPCNELMVFIDKPQFRLGRQFYFKDSQVGRFFNFSLLEPPFNFPRIEKSFILSRIIGKFVSKDY